MKRTLSTLASLSALMLGSCLFFAPAANAQAPYPNHPIRMIVPFPAGGGVDIYARLLSDRLSTAMGQPVVVDNRAGANTAIGAAAVATAAADGYTLLFTLDSTMTMNPYLADKLPYDAAKDFAPITLLSAYSMVLVSGPKAQFQNLRDVINFAKANPGKLEYGAGSPVAMLAGELFNESAGVSIVRVPYKGSAPVIQSLAAGDIALAYADFASALPFIKSGKLKALATTGTTRASTLPDVPTIRESGIAGYDVTGWTGLFAPAGTPPAVVARLNKEVGTIASDAAFVEKVRQLTNSDVISTTSEEIRNRQTNESAKWGALIKKSGISISN